MPDKYSWFSPMQKLLITLCVIGLIMAAIYFIRDLMLPFFLSFVLAYLLNPIVDRLEFIFKKRLLAVAILYLIFGLVFVFLAVFMLPIITSEAVDLYEKAPFYLDNGKQFLVSLKHTYELKYPVLVQFKVIDSAMEQTQKLLLSLASDIPNILLSIVSVISYLALVPLVLFFFLLQGPEMRHNILCLIPNRYFEMVLILQYKISSQLGNYLRGILIEAGIVGGLSGFFLLLLGVDYALIIGSVAGICNLIPYLGPVSGAIPAMIVFYLKTGTIKSVVYIIVLFAVVQFIDNMLVQPIIYSQSIDLHPLIVLFAVIVGGTFGGLWGLVLAVPIAGVIKVISHQVYKELQFRLQIRLEKSP